MAKENLQQVSCWVDSDLYKRLRQKLLDQNLSFTNWIDKMMRKDLGLPAKFSYGKEE
jgi:hypothetical protein